MKNFFAVFFLITVALQASFAQTEPKPTEWKEIGQPENEFSVEFPVDYEFFESAAGKPSQASRRYSKIADGAYFYIFSDHEKSAWQNEFVLKFADNYQQTGKSEVISGFETEKYFFTDNEGFFHNILFVKGKSRFYIFQTVSAFEENPGVERFFKSLKLKPVSSDSDATENKTSQEVVITIPDGETDLDSKDPAIKVKTKDVTGLTVNGTGRGNGIGNGLGAAIVVKPTPAPTDAKVTSGIKISSKPKSLYTDLARFYQISGKVVLRVTFMANGTIGAITPISKLPFGLTQQAVIAARGIQFEPALREGVPYSVSRPVEYTFTIY